MLAQHACRITHITHLYHHTTHPCTHNNNTLACTQPHNTTHRHALNHTTQHTLMHSTTKHNTQACTQPHNTTHRHGFVLTFLLKMVVMLLDKDFIRKLVHPTILSWLIKEEGGCCARILYMHTHKGHLC